MIIVGRCPACREHRLHVRDLTVRICINNDERTCTYACPGCGRGVSRLLSHDKSRRLIDMGVKLVFWRYPLELYERHHGAPIGYGDVSVFCEKMARSDWLSELAAS